MKFGELLQSLTFDLERVKRVNVDIYIGGNYKINRNVQELQNEMKNNEDKGLQLCEVIKWYMPDQDIDRFTVNLKPHSLMLNGNLLYSAEASFPCDIPKKKVYVVAKDKKDAETQLRNYLYNIFGVYFFNINEVTSLTDIFNFTYSNDVKPGIYERNS